MGTPRAFVAAIGLASLLLARPGAADDWSPPPGDADAVELHRRHTDRQSQFEDPVTKRRWGRADILVNAPASAVRAAVLDFAGYSNFLRMFKKSKILKQDLETADVYLQLPILKGAATLWAVQHFTMPRADGRGEVLAGTMLKGNVSDLQTVWRWRAVDDQHTIVTLEVTGVPNIPLPKSLVAQQLQEACGDGVNDIRNYVERQLRTARR